MTVILIILALLAWTVLSLVIGSFVGTAMRICDERDRERYGLPLRPVELPDDAKLVLRG